MYNNVFQVQIPADRLSKLLQQRAKAHSERATRLQAAANAAKAAAKDVAEEQGIEDYGSTTMNKVSETRYTAQHETAVAKKLSFLANLIDESDTPYYSLSTQDIRELELDE